jgi:flavin-dependent dehydrogenase
MRRDPLIIGAGPAGSAAAITLGRAGYRPALVERTRGPTDKVCGDFLSLDAIQQARALGVDPSALGAAPIERIRLIHGERAVEAALPFPAFGLSRRAFDAALLRQAEGAGAVLHSGLTINHLTRESIAPPARIGAPGISPGISGETGQWRAQTGGQAGFAADTVFLATGKHDLRDLPRPRTERGAIGMKMYFALAPGAARMLDGAIELTLFPGGYAGMQAVEDGQTVLCIAVQKQAFQGYGAGWPGLIAAIERHSHRFATMLDGARTLLPRPLAVAGIPYGYQVRPVSADGLFRLGDQAAVIPSLTGDGMAIALHTGRTAAEAWLNGDDSPTYHRSLARTLAPQMRLAGLLHHACMSAPVQAAVLRAAALFPVLLRHAASRTRLPSHP